MYSITVVIPSYNRPEWMLKTAGHVLDQSLNSVCEILLIDQTPWHNIQDQLQEQILKLKENRLIKYCQLNYPNLPRARNYALSIAKGDIILFLDDDVLLPPNFIKEHLICYNDSEVIAVTGELFQRNEGFSLFDLNIENPEIGCFKVYDRGFNLQHTRHLSGGNHSVLSVYAKRCGGYDEFFSTLGEDVDFTNRLRNTLKNEKIAFNPEAYILHLRVPHGGCRLSGSSAIPEYKHLAGQFLLDLRYSEKSSFKILRENLRLGPLRKENIIKPWRQPYAWYSYFKGFFLSLKNKDMTKNSFL